MHPVCCGGKGKRSNGRDRRSQCLVAADAVAAGRVLDARFTGEREGRCDASACKGWLTEMPEAYKPRASLQAISRRSPQSL